MGMMKLSGTTRASVRGKSANRGSNQRTRGASRYVKATPTNRVVPPKPVNLRSMKSEQGLEPNVSLVRNHGNWAATKDEPLANVEPTTKETLTSSNESPWNRITKVEEPAPIQQQVYSAPKAQFNTSDFPTLNNENPPSSPPESPKLEEVRENQPKPLSWADLLLDEGEEEEEVPEEPRNRRGGLTRFGREPKISQLERHPPDRQLFDPVTGTLQSDIPRKYDHKYYTNQSNDKRKSNAKVIAQKSRPNPSSLPSSSKPQTHIVKPQQDPVPVHENHKPRAEPLSTSKSQLNNDSEDAHRGQTPNVAQVTLDGTPVTLDAIASQRDDMIRAAERARKRKEQEEAEDKRRTSSAQEKLRLLEEKIKQREEQEKREELEKHRLTEAAEAKLKTKQAPPLSNNQDVDSKSSQDGDHQSSPKPVRIKQRETPLPQSSPETDFESKTPQNKTSYPKGKQQRANYNKEDKQKKPNTKKKQDHFKKGSQTFKSDGRADSRNSESGQQTDSQEVDQSTSNPKSQYTKSNRGGRGRGGFKNQGDRVPRNSNASEHSQKGKKSNRGKQDNSHQRRPSADSSKSTQSKESDLEPTNDEITTQHVPDQPQKKTNQKKQNKRNSQKQEPATTNSEDSVSPPRVPISTLPVAPAWKKPETSVRPLQEILADQQSGKDAIGPQNVPEDVQDSAEEKPKDQKGTSNQNRRGRDQKGKPDQKQTGEKDFKHKTDQQNRKQTSKRTNQGGNNQNPKQKQSNQKKNQTPKEETDWKTEGFTGETPALDQTPEDIPHVPNERPVLAHPYYGSKTAVNRFITIESTEENSTDQDQPPTERKAQHSNRGGKNARGSNRKTNNKSRQSYNRQSNDRNPPKDSSTPEQTGPPKEQTVKKDQTQTDSQTADRRNGNSYPKQNTGNSSRQPNTTQRNDGRGRPKNRGQKSQRGNQSTRYNKPKPATQNPDHPTPKDQSTPAQPPDSQTNSQDSTSSSAPKQRKSAPKRQSQPKVRKSSPRYMYVPKDQVQHLQDAPNTKQQNTM